MCHNTCEVSNMQIRTDLAMEAHELWQRSAPQQTQLSGVWARTQHRRGYDVTTVRILDENGARQLEKPMGTYVTLELEALRRREKNAFSQAVHALRAQLRQFLMPCERFLVVGLGNDAVTPDAVGPLALRQLIVTRHLKTMADVAVDGFKTVSAAQPGVLGATGIESLELVRGVAERTKPEQVIVIDALASSEPQRICAAVQLSDSGIVPGSGVGNSRAAFNRETLGVPVLAVGVPTVVDAAAIADAAQDREALHGMIVTPHDIDARVHEIAKLIGYALNLSLHAGLTMDDIPCFFS